MGSINTNDINIGKHASIINKMFVFEPKMISNITDIVIPIPSIMASIGLSIPNINVDFLVLAGTKYPFIMYHTPFILFILYLQQFHFQKFVF